jgi:hypothetical protein
MYIHMYVYNVYMQVVARITADNLMFLNKAHILKSTNI